MDPLSTTNHPASRAIRRLPLPALAALLCSCAAIGPGGWDTRSLAVGEPRERVLASMGPPSATHVLPAGATRLEYSHPPMGRQTFMVDLDAAGNVTQWRQVLDEREFARLRVGLSQEDVRTALGPPSERGRYARPTPADFWIYRFESGDHCLIFQVAFDPVSGRTIDAGDYLVDPRCGMSGE